MMLLFLFLFSIVLSIMATDPDQSIVFVSQTVDIIVSLQVIYCAYIRFSKLIFINL